MTTTDEDEHYRRLTEQEIRSTLHPKSLGLTLSGQPISVLADLSVEFDKASQEVFWGLEPVVDDDLDAGAEAFPEGNYEDGRPEGTEADPKSQTETGVVAAPSSAPPDAADRSP